MYTSPLRFSGMASGMDTDSIVKQLMDAHRMPVNKLYQKKQTTEWRRDAYREMNTKLWDFRNNKLFDFKREGNLSSRTATISGNAAALNAKVTGDASLSTLTVKVTQLATAASNKSTASMTSSSAFDQTKALGTQAANLSGSFTQTIPGTYDKEYFKINGTEIEVDPNVDSLDDVIKRINEKTNVTGFYAYNSVGGGQISFVSKQTGQVNGTSKDQALISFQDTSGDFLADVLKITGPGTSAVNATATVNGLNVERTSNTFSVNGVELTLNKLTGTDPDTIIQVRTNTDTMVEAIKGFIKDYNEVLKTLNDKTKETKYRDFTPLTDEQKESMKEKDIELWESKAKSGLLRSDSILRDAISKMRLAASGQVETGNRDYTSLSSIGIDTGEYFENGKLYINESKLRAAIEADADAVIAIFTANGNESDRSDMGIAERIYEDLDKTLDDLTDKAGLDIGLSDGSILSKQINRLSEEIDDWNERLAITEDRYYRQFTAMERAMSQYNSQSSYLMQSFGG